MSGTHSNSSVISTSAIENIIDKLKYERNRASTNESYYRTWKQFNEFFIRLDRKPKSWEERIILFVGYLVEGSVKSSTIKSYISAIKSVLRADGVELDEDIYLLTSLTRACRYKNDRIYTRLPIKRNFLTLLMGAIQDLVHQ